MNTNFIIPSLFYWNQPFKQQPLTQLYLSTIIDENFQGKDVSIKITDLRAKPKEELSKYVSRDDVYFYSIASPDYAEVKQLVNDLREKYPDSKHIAGGAHVNIFPEETCARSILFAITAAWVPLPAPGGPKSTIYFDILHLSVNQFIIIAVQL